MMHSHSSESIHIFHFNLTYCVYRKYHSLTKIPSKEKLTTSKTLNFQPQITANMS